MFFILIIIMIVFMLWFGFKIQIIFFWEVGVGMSWIFSIIFNMVFMSKVYNIVRKGDDLLLRSEGFIVNFVGYKLWILVKFFILEGI